MFVGAIYVMMSVMDVIQMNSNVMIVILKIHGATIWMKYLIMGMKHKRFALLKNV